MYRINSSCRLVSTAVVPEFLGKHGPQILARRRKRLGGIDRLRTSPHSRPKAFDQCIDTDGEQSRVMSGVRAAGDDLIENLFHLLVFTGAQFRNDAPVLWIDMTLREKCPP